MAGAGTNELFDQKVAENETLFKRLGVVPTTKEAAAVDAGCGSGYQSLALARLGFKVTGIDTSATLLKSLGSHAERLGLADRVTTVTDDMLEFAKHNPGQLEAFVCMGDTLTHLKSLDDVKEMLSRAAKSLVPGKGKLVLSWRDLSHPLEGLDRFIPVRSDDSRLFTCFIEDGEGQGPGSTVKVHDLLYSKSADGTWQFTKSWYPKLKLDKATVQKLVEEAGFRVESAESGRMLVLLAVR